jgi:hypothetical protein
MFAAGGTDSNPGDYRQRGIGDFRKMRIAALSLACLGLVACADMNPPPAYVVFFDGHQTALSSGAKDIVDHAAGAARLKPGAMVQVAGPSTRVAPGYDPRFAQPRIDAVVAELHAEGVSDDKIVQTSLTTDGIKVDASGAQRVELRVVQPGS